MSYRQFLDEAIGDSPASTIDVDQVIGRQRRKSRLRRWGVCSGAAAAVLGVVATAALGLPSAGRQPAPAERPRITTVAGTPEDVARLDAAVIAAVTRRVPGVKWKDELSPGRPRWHYGGPSGTEPPNTIEHYFVQGGMTVDGVEGHLMVQLERFASRRTRMSCPYSSPSATCLDSVGPNGERIEVLTSGRTDKGPDGQVRTSSQNVQVVGPGDVLVMVTLMSWSQLDGALPLTVEQQTAIALDPALALAPVPPGAVLTPPPPLPSEAPPTPPSSPSPPSGPFDPAQQKRIDNAVFAALRRQVPAVKGANGSYATPIDLASEWTDTGGDNTADAYWGQGRLLLGRATGNFSVRIWRTDPGFYGDLTCAKPTKVYSCTAGVGPHGEKYRTVTRTGGSAEREVNVWRADGSWLSVTLGGDGGKFPLTPAQQQAIAFDTAIALAPVK